MSSIILYHGSYTVVEVPDLSKCREGKDFGRGFYLTTSKSQAERFVRSSVGKAIKNGITVENSDAGYVSIFEYNPFSNVAIHEFRQCDASWLKCIAGFRRQIVLPNEASLWDDYDIIIGKIANDNTNRTITNYINGDYGDVNSDRAVNFAISLLLPERLSDQFCFRSDTAVKCLKFIDSYEVKIK